MSEPAISPPPSSTTAPPSPTTDVPASPTPIAPMAQSTPSPPPPIVTESPPTSPPPSPLLQTPVVPPPQPPPSPPAVSPPQPTPSPPILPSPPPQPTPSPPVVPPPQPTPSPPSQPTPSSPPQPTPSPPMVPPPKPTLPPPSQPTPSPPVVPPPKPTPSPPVVPPPQPTPSPPVVPPPQPTPSPPVVPPPQPTPSPPILPPPSPPSPSQDTSPPPPTPDVPPKSPPTKPEPSPPPDAPPTSPERISSPPPPETPSSPSIPSTNSSNDSPGTDVTEKDSNGGGIKVETVIGIGAAVVFGLFLVAVLFWCVKRRKKNDGYIMPTSVRSPDSQLSEMAHPSAPLFRTPSSSCGVYSSPELGSGNSKSRFTYDELSEATNDFSDENILGEGGFGCVYKGYLSDGRNVAVKQLKVGGGQGEREFQAEVEIISRVHHRHLVSLVGCCIENNQRLLVYDFVPNNTLHYHLHGNGGLVMDWATRIKVAAGAARGIAYLHEDCHPRIIHRDIKSSNILLDDSFEAQVSDFGLAKLTIDAQTHVTTRVMGTFGYMAPEYATSGKLTDRSDVFSFGVVLLELITGRKSVDTSQPLGDESLVEWARPLMSRALESGSFEGLPDSHLSENYNENEMFTMIEAAAACVRHSASMRPRMGMVMRALDDLTSKNKDLQNGVRPGNSELYTGSANSEERRIFNRMAFGGELPLYTSDFSNSTWSSRQDQ